MSYSFLPFRSVHEWTSQLYKHTLNINVTLTNTRLRVAHSWAGWIFKSTKIKMHIIFNQTTHISLNHLENTAVGPFQCTPASLYLSVRAVLRGVVHHCTYIWILMPQRDVSTPEEHFPPAGRKEPGSTEDHVEGNCLIESY